MNFSHLETTVDFDTLPQINVEQDTIELADEHFSGFKTIGVACCIAIIAVDNQSGVPVAMSHYSGVRSDDSVEVAHQDLLRHLDRIDFLVGEEFDLEQDDSDHCDIRFVMIGGQIESENTIRAALKINEHQHFKINPDEMLFGLASDEDALDVYCTGDSVYYQSSFNKPLLTAMKLSATSATKRRRLKL